MYYSPYVLHFFHRIYRMHSVPLSLTSMISNEAMYIDSYLLSLSIYFGGSYPYLFTLRLLLWQFGHHT
jgi:hypothetical protein